MIAAPALATASLLSFKKGSIFFAEGGIESLILSLLGADNLFVSL